MILVIMIYMHTFMKKEYPRLALNKRIIYYGHRYILVGYSTSTEV